MSPSSSGRRHRRTGPLTARGWTLVLLGTGLCAAAVWLGQRDLLRLGVLLTALPVLALVLTLRARSCLTLDQRSRSFVLGAGQRGAVRLTIRGTGGRAGVRARLEDAVPFVLGTAPRLPVPPLEPGRTLNLDYTVSSDVRGAYRLGPAVLRLEDALGLCEVRRTLAGTTAVDVLPVVHPLPALPLREPAGPGGSSARPAGRSEDADDAGLRQYRAGDDVRRVHWRSTARRGEVMVRTEEHGGRAEAVVLLDRRAGAHRGRGAASSLEWAVSAAASIEVELQRRGYAVRLVHGGPLPAAERAAAPAAVRERALLRELATLGPGGDDDLQRAVQSLGRSGSSLVVALLGAVDASDALVLDGARAHGTTALAVLQRTRAWDRSGPGGEDAATERAALALTGAGWRTAVAGPGDRIADVWAALALGATARRPA